MPNLLQDKKLIGQEITWLQNLRNLGRQKFAEQGVPSAKIEAWKYTKPRDLNADDFVMDSPVCHCEAISAIPFSCYQVHFINGIFNPAGSLLPDGVEVLPLIEAIILKAELRNYLGRLVDVEHQPFAALNTAYLNEGVYIHVEKNVNLKKPIVLVNHTNAGNQNLFYNLRNVIILEAGSSAILVEDYNYNGEVKSRYFGNHVNEIFLSAGAHLQHYKRQDEAFKAHHIALSAVEVKTGAFYQSFCLQKGANISRNETNVRLAESQAKAEVNAAYLMNGWATLDTTTNIEHLAPHTFSEQLVKGVVGGDAKGVFQGKIHIAKGAVKAEGKQQHRALLLSDTAEIDVKPELEIFADDVKCSHGAASGELDEAQLFYMQSRGISLADAKQILIDAYIEDVLGKIADESIREWFRVTS